MFSKKNFEKLKKKILKKTVNVSVVGLGYVGLPLANLIQKNKFNVVGYDIDKNKIKSLNQKKNYIPYLKFNFSNRIAFTYDIDDIKKSDIVIIALPTPLKNKKPNLEYIKKFVDKFEKNFENKLIIFESTSYPGTMREYFIDRLKIKRKLVSGKDVFFSFSPERINPGQNENTLSKIPKIISGETKYCKLLIKHFYSKIFDKVYLSTNIETAEFTKILENVYRAVNIAFINEIKYLAEPLNVNLIDAIEGAKTKPFGYEPFYPGPGIGGHCIPIDPLYLTWKAKQIGLKTRFINLSEQINRENVQKIFKCLSSIKKKYTRFNVLILGVSYKKNIDDIRESSSIKLMRNLKDKNLNFEFCDPFVEKLSKDMPEINFNKKSLNVNKIDYKKFQVTILMTDHDKFKYKEISKNSGLIIDTRYRFMKMNIINKNIINL